MTTPVTFVRQPAAPHPVRYLGERCAVLDRYVGRQTPRDRAPPQADISAGPVR